MNVIARYTYKMGEEKILTIVNKLDFEALKQIKPAVQRNHLVMTLEELKDATDVFPLEILTMKTTGKLTEGKDILAEIEITKKDIRKQLEFELRSKIIHLRELYFQAKTDKDNAIIVAKTLPALTPLIEGLLFLKGETEQDINIAIERVSKIYDVELEITKPDGEKYIKQLYEALIKLTEKVDKIKA